MESAKIVQINSLVTVNINGVVKKFKIVEPKSIDLSQGHISYESPIGKAIIGRGIGEIATYTNIQGESINIEIISIENND